MSVSIPEDRSMCVRPDQVVMTAWVDIDACRLGCRDRMAPEAVAEKWRRLLCLGDCAPWPPIVGHWDSDRFVVCDGRHEFIASLMHGRERLFVAWLLPAEQQDLPTAVDVGAAPELVPAA